MGFFFGAITAIATVVLAGVAVKQMRSAREQSGAALEALRRQTQPLVFAHERHGPQTNASDVEYRYYLKNEGLGPALNIEHGVEIYGKDYPFGEGMQFRTAQPGEYLPRLEEKSAAAPDDWLSVNVPIADLQVGRERTPRVYWTRFEGVFGDRWEVRNPYDPREPAKVRRLS